MRYAEVCARALRLSLFSSEICNSKAGDWSFSLCLRIISMLMSICVQRPLQPRLS